MKESAYLVQFVPKDAWILISSDEAVDVWVTKSSLSVAMQHFESVGENSTQQVVDIIRFSDEITAVILNRQTSQLKIECRCRAANRVYAALHASTIRISIGLQHAVTGLPFLRLAKQFVAVWLASALRFGNLDHFLGNSPFESIYLVGQGLSLVIDLTTGVSSVSQLNEQSLDTDDRKYRKCSLDQLIQNCRSALFQTIELQTKAADVVAECSGGIDSSLVAVVANRITTPRFHGGVFVDYPYHEFRKEKEYAMLVASAGRFPLLTADPSLAEYWGASIQAKMPNHDLEPSLFLPFWGQVLCGHSFVHQYDRSVILTGLGGDLLFQYQPVPYAIPNHHKPNWINDDLWDRLMEAMSSFRSTFASFGRAPTGLEYSNLWVSRALEQCFQGAEYCSPLAGRAVISSFAMLRDHIRESQLGHILHSHLVQKPLAYLVFADYLPAEVWRRRSKINFVGNYYRFWWKHGWRMIRLIEKMQSQLVGLGFDPRILLTQVREMSQGRRSSEVLLNAFLTYLYWLNHFTVWFNSR